MPRPDRTSASTVRAARVGVASCPAWLVVGAVTPRAAAAAPERASVRLAYAREAGAERCPDESALRDAVMARLGYDPFDDRAARVLRAEVRRSGSALVAHLEIRDAMGVVQGRRELEGARDDCAELGTARAIALSLGIDPLSAVAPRPSPPVAPPVVLAPEAAVAPQVVVAERPPPAPAAPAPGVPIRARFGAGAVLAWGVAPSGPSVGGIADAGVRRGPWSLDLEGAGSWASTTGGSGADGEGITSSLFTGSLAPCVHVWFGLGCALVGVGALAATGVVRVSESGHAVFADAGARLGVDIPFAGRFFAHAHGEGLATFTHVTYHLDGQAAWSTPPVSAAFGLGLGVELWARFS